MQELSKKLAYICFLAALIPLIMLAVFPKEMELWVILMLSLFLVGFIFFIVSLIVRILSHRKILNEGQPAQAKILSVQDLGGSTHDHSVLLFSLEVKTAEGIINASAKKLVSIVDVASYQPGRIIEVKYLPGTQKVAVV